MKEMLRRVLFVLFASAPFEFPGLSRLKNALLRASLGAGAGCTFGAGCMVGSPHRLTPPTPRIGRRVQFMIDSFVDLSGGVEIGDDVWISRGALLLTHTHGCKTRAPRREQGTRFFPLVVGRDAWISTRAIVLPSVGRIGEGAVIGAGAVVTKEVPPWAIMAGNPARQIGTRGEDAPLPPEAL